jgi:hypothetical protein
VKIDKEGKLHIDQGIGMTSAGEEIHQPTVLKNFLENTRFRLC